MSKFFLFIFLAWLLGNPFLAFVVLLIIIYVLDRRFVGVFPSITRPIKRDARLRKLRREIALNAYDTSAKHEAAKLLIEKKRYNEALKLLHEVAEVKEDSADVKWKRGFCLLRTGQIEQGEQSICEALELNPRVGYGEPYLRLAEVFAASDREKALRYLESFRGIHSSSCEGNYRLGQLYQALGQSEEAKRAYRETVDIYRTLPKYMRRKERRWALLAAFRR
ncbi:tetratricopeptide repeat protein [Paenibacillus turpanensis]|uniref:tetratricopeptide repeat protein n=1 Tax=Paenibacillus turpanensis TaxID=2689078 RepID=UPI00140E3D89|nr:tetratricopeptide repeat protein [Paenibacillus turpanensis]